METMEQANVVQVAQPVGNRNLGREEVEELSLFDNYPDAVAAVARRARSGVAAEKIWMVEPTRSAGRATETTCDMGIVVVELRPRNCHRMHRRMFSAEYKANAAGLVLYGGHRCRDVARELDLDYSTLLRWVTDEKRYMLGTPQLPNAPAPEFAPTPDETEPTVPESPDPEPQPEIPGPPDECDPAPPVESPMLVNA